MSRQIPLTQGQFAIVDDEDFAWLSQWKWTAQATPEGKFYAMRRESRRLVLMHRLINETPAHLVTDHRDGNGLNNQRGNLRNATELENMMNRRGKRGGTSSHKGVWFDAAQAGKKKWRSAIRINGRLKYLGRFETEEQAGAAYAEAAVIHFGQFACSEKGKAA